MSRRPKYPTDELGRALLWRHQHVMRALESGALAYGRQTSDPSPDEVCARHEGLTPGKPPPAFWPEYALVLVVEGRWNGNDDLLEASLAAIREKAAA